ncbi:hypothetical protein EDD16DRAFT_1550269 [Pisolithus croceorrhizus]|nr:hypothetical protein EDD16DRAFT_1550269 [Pisolithus croceorrhizus]
MDLAEKALNGFSRATAVGAFVADHISIRTSTFDGAGWSTGFPAAYVPEWFPDTDFEVRARGWHTDLQNIIDQLFGFVES